ncbi:MAG: hypothetical protein B0A82_14165 [Alkalinema sp. CACIAM 70d]|nr:MAG: hypothetical protein B0A82_14165 [Alkalinema sp. CACIAM 70d]
MRRFFGKYRGKVTNNKDPLRLGRVQVSVPAIFGEGRESWALPCSPYAGKDVGFFAIPPLESNIWVEFEAGDPDYPIWAGCFWGTDQLPKEAAVEDPVKVQVFKVEGITLVWSNLGDNKGVSLTIEPPVVDRTLKMIFNADGITLNNKDETTIKIMADKIEIKNKANSTATIYADNIDLQESSTEVKLTASEIDLTCNPATIKLSASAGIDLNNAPGNAKINSSGIELSATVPKVKITPAEIDLQNTAADIKLSPVSVNVNNGALEVI